jgi:hypothetical protein
MRKIIMAGLMALALTVWLAAAASAFIVDTGQPPSVLGGVSLFNGQDFAGQFTTSKEYLVTSVQGWIGGSTGTLKFAILTDNGGVPDTIKFSQDVSISNRTDAWQGPTGLSWDLPAGTYWAGFLVVSFDGYMPTPAPSPLTWYAWHQGGSWNPVNADYDWVGIRVDGNPVSAVPLPGTVVLLGSGLSGLGAWRRFRKS